MILEVGLNHLGSTVKAKKYINFFLKSRYKNLTFQINTLKYYENFAHKLDLNFYDWAIKKAKLKNKKIGLAVCDPETFREYLDLDFSFYKLLSIGINNYNLIKLLNKKNKNIFVSLGIANNKTISKCLKIFNKKNKTKLKLIYTSLSYDSKDLNLSRIEELKRKFKIDVGYGHHYKNDLPILLSKFYKPDFIFVYIKSREINKFDSKLPDDVHAINIEDLPKLEYRINETFNLIKKKKLNTDIKIYKKVYV